MKKILLFSLAVLLSFSMLSVAVFAEQVISVVDEVTVPLTETFFTAFSDLGIDSEGDSLDYTFSYPWHVYDNYNHRYVSDVSYISIFYDGLETMVSIYLADGTFVGPGSSEWYNYSLESSFGSCTISSSVDVSSELAVSTFNEFIGFNVLKISDSPVESESVPAVDDSPVYTGIFSIFSQITTWIVSALITLVSLFWVDGSLTFFGILSLVALGVAIFFLLVRVLQNFLHFRS